MNQLKSICILVCFFFFYGCGLRPQHQMHDMSPAEVETIKISSSSKIETIESVGELISPQTTEVNSEIMGKIVYLNIPEGMEVPANHILAKIDDSTTLAEIKVAKAKLQNASENFKRMQALKSEGAISQQVLDNATEGLKTAEGEVEKAESLETKNSIFAPYIGVLSLKQVSLGAFIDSGDPVVRISQINPLHLLFSLPEQYVSQVKIDQVVKFTLNDSLDVYSAKVAVIDPYIDPDTRSVQIKAVVPNKKRELLPGRSVKISLEVSNIPNVVSLPIEAVIQDGDKEQVAVVDENNTVSIKEVKISKWDKDSVLISSGLVNGEVVITSGHQKIHPGTMVILKSFNSIHNKILDKEIPE